LRIEPLEGGGNAWAPGESIALETWSADREKGSGGIGDKVRREVKGVLSLTVSRW